jgi:nicotinamide-nucleotide amidase
MTDTLDPLHYGQSSIRQLAAQLGQTLFACNSAVTVAESCTGGGIAEAITAVPGASHWFECGFVVYSNRAKHRFLDVPLDLLQRQGAVSEAVVQAMVSGAIAKSGAQFGVAVSGIAGPSGGTPDKPVGQVWFAWISPRGTITECHQLKGDRDQVRNQTVRIALERLIRLTQDICIKTH